MEGRVTSRATGAAGRYVLTRAGAFLDHFGLLTRVFATLVRRRGQGRRLIRRVTVEQVYFTGVQAVPIVSLSAVLLGALVILESAERLSRVGLEDFLGRVMVLLIVRELGPIMTALLVILRSGVAIAIELGYMTALREIEAIETQGVDPLHVIAIPRVIGMLTAIVCLFIYFDLVAMLGGSLFAWLIMGVPLSRLAWGVARAVVFSDVAIGLVKAFFFGGAISLICIYRGITTRRDLTAIPPQVSRAAVECLVACLALDVAISALFYL
jgi:phospholipid/cholesterol/gamma-HCH transport system permease protein